MAWEEERTTLESLIKTGMLERVPPNLSAAQSLVEVAETHLNSDSSTPATGSRAGASSRERRTARAGSRRSGVGAERGF